MIFIFTPPWQIHSSSTLKKASKPCETLQKRNTKFCREKMEKQYHKKEITES